MQCSSIFSLSFSILDFIIRRDVNLLIIGVKIYWIQKLIDRIVVKKKKNFFVF